MIATFLICLSLPPGLSPRPVFAPSPEQIYGSFECARIGGVELRKIGCEKPRFDVDDYIATATA